MKTRTKAGITGVALATATAMMVTAPSATGDHQSESSAYGLSLGGQAGQPSVEYKGGKTKKGGGEIPQNPLLYGGLLALTAGDDFASAKVTDLVVGEGATGLPQELKDGLAELQAACQAFEEAEPTNEAINPLNEALNELPGGAVIDIPNAEAAAAFCEALLDAEIPNLAEVGLLQVECKDTEGTVVVEDVTALGAPTPEGISGSVEQDTMILPEQLAPIVQITLNRQTTSGENFTVDGLVLEVGGEEVAVLASATCGGPIADPTKPPTNNPGPAPAPAPTPVEQSVPVTG